jgi:hypothetical protein
MFLNEIMKQPFESYFCFMKPANLGRVVDNLENLFQSKRHSLSGDPTHTRDPYKTQ